MKKDFRKEIVFVEADAMDMQAKLAKQFKDRGYRTILITITKSSKKSNFILNSYDQIIDFNFKFFKIGLKALPKIAAYSLIQSKYITKALISMKKLKPYVVIVRGPPNWFCVFIKNYFKKFPVIYYPYDIRSHAYEDLATLKKENIKMFEVKAEKKCFETMDGIIHKGSFDELENLNKKILGKVNITCPTLHVLPYTLKELSVPLNKNKLSRKDKNIHIVYAGCILDVPSFPKSVDELLKQKIHFHMYIKHSPLTKEEWLKYSGRDYKRFESSPYFHLHDELSQSDLMKEISKYDYASWIGFYDDHRGTIKYGMGNKFSTYLEAGLPLIHFKSHEYIGYLTKKYGTGVGVDFNEFKHLRKVLSKINYSQMLKNIVKTRNELELKNHIPKLENFFIEVRKNKYNQN